MKNKIRYFLTIVLLLIPVLIAFNLPGKAVAAEGKSITIAAAANLSFAFRDIAAGFEKETGISVILSLGSTGNFTKQITEGAPFDIFFAADREHIDDLSEKGYLIPSSVENYARGVLVLAVNRASGTDVKELRDLLKPEIKNVAIANPGFAPYGKAAMEALKSSGLWERLGDKIVYGEDIRQTLQFIQTGNAESGFVSLSIADVPEITYVRVAPSLYKPVDQAVGILKGSKEQEAARSFIRYVKGPVGSEVMRKYGFIVP